MQKINALQAQSLAGLFTFSLRLVVGWTYFSALWRRLVLADKLDPDTAGYISVKFNHFLPNALGIKPMIEYMVTHPDLLWWAMVIFTVIEGIVGLLIMFGFMTRLMSVGVFGLAMGILLGSGWIGTTCLDEWQIGILGIASGFTLFFTGSGHYSLDYFLLHRYPLLQQKRWFQWLGSGVLPIRSTTTKNVVLIGSLLIFGLSLFTNQYFHGGLWGTLHNKSVSPELVINNVSKSGEILIFDLYRTEGVDVYGSFVVEIELLNEEHEVISVLDTDTFNDSSSMDIKNHYIASIQKGKRSLLEIPLGAKATIQIKLPSELKGNPSLSYLKLVDVSGKTWKAMF